MTMTTAAMNVAERELVIGGKTILGYTPLKPQQKKLEEILRKGNYTPSTIRESLKLNMVIVIKDNSIEFWTIDGTNIIRSDAVMTLMDDIMAKDYLSDEEKCRFLQGATGHLAPIHHKDYHITFERF